MKKDLDWGNVEADAAHGEAIMFGRELTTTELKYILTEPKLGHVIPEKFVEDFFEFAQAVNCDLSLMAFYRWYRLPSLSSEENDLVVEALKAQQSVLHMHLEADIETLGDPMNMTVLALHKNMQRQSEVLTSLINRMGICPHHKGHLWCVLDRHPRDVEHVLA